MTSVDEAASNRRRRTELFTIAFVLLTYFAAWWLVTDRTVGSRFSTNYYQSLTEGFLAGHTYLTIEPDPRLAKLENPWAGYQGIPRVHDATYFNGRYYLYFGPTPVVLAYLPYRVVTGLSLSNHAATLFFVGLGFLGSAVTWRRFAHRIGYKAGHVLIHVGLLTLGLGSFTTILIGSDTLYSVPIAAAYACCAWAVFFCYRSLTSERKGALAWLAAGSFAAGLAVGARPNWVFATTSLLVPGIVLFLRRRDWRDGLATAGALVCPIAAIGLSLAYYNYVRFGSPFEFGVKYQFAAEDQRFVKLWNLDLAPGHFWDYLFNGAQYGFYFPFVRSKDSIGLLPWAPLSAIGLAGTFCACLPRVRKSVGRPDGWILFGMLSFLGWVNLLSLSGVAFQNDRYSVDFFPLFVFSALVGLAWKVAAPVGGGLLARRSMLAVASALIAVTVFQSVCLGMRFLNFDQRFPETSLAINRASALVEGWMGAQYGPAEIELSFPQGQKGRSEPIVTSADGRDCVFVTYLSEYKAQMRFFHVGVSGPVSEPFELKPGAKRKLFVDMGGLYPDSNHPLFSAWSKKDVDRVRTRVSVTLDGVPLIEREVFFYPSDHNQVHFGSTPTVYATEKNFSGSIDSVKRFGLSRNPAPTESRYQPGWFRLKLEIPEKPVQITEPLLAMGSPQAGQMLCITYVDTKHLRLGFSVKGFGLIETAPFPYDADKPAVIDFGLSAATSRFPDRLEDTNVEIRFNDSTVMKDRTTTQPFDADSIAVGINSVLFGHSDQVFSGRKLSVERLPAPADSADAALQNAKRIAPGPLRLWVRFKPDGIGRTEPLIVVGRRGAANCLGVRMLNESEFQFVVDSWGVALVESGRIPYEKNVMFPIDVDGGLLYPSGDNSPEARKMRGSIRVAVSEKVVWDAQVKFCPVADYEVTLGANRIDLSTVTRDFTGRLQGPEKPVPFRN